MGSVELLVLALVSFVISLLFAVMLLAVARRCRGTVLWGIPYDRLSIGMVFALLAVAAGLLASGYEVMANDFAVMAYYLLALGAVLRILRYIRQQGTRKIRARKHRRG